MSARPARPWRARAAAAALAALLVAAESGCTDRDLAIKVSPTGRAVLGTACRNYEAACAAFTEKTACDLDVSCRWDGDANGCVLQGRCHRNNNPTWSSRKPRAIELLLIGRDALDVRASSRCVSLGASRDPSCASPTGPDVARCAAQAMNEAVTRAAPAGLSYDGLEDRSSAFPVVAVYQFDALPAECAGGLDTPACTAASLACPVSDLVACAGLAPPVSDQSYDITCASCQDGLSFSLGADTSPCPGSGGLCFFEVCAKALGAQRDAGAP